MVDLNDNGHTYSDSSDNEEQYSKLAAQVSQLDSTQRVKAPSRRELSSQVSEFYLPKPTSTSSVHVGELAEVLNQKSKLADVKKKLNTVTKQSKTLPKPLEKAVAERIKRSLGFENVQKQLDKWSGVIVRNRLSEHMNFPLKQDSVTVYENKAFFSKFSTKTDLEVKIENILHPEKEKLIEEVEENIEEDFPLTLEEMISKRKEMAHLRARQRYQELKAKRQSKIKSKKYHRILKREKIKKQLKEFELLQKSDPEAALKKLEELEKNRAQERASLRHRSTGKWAKSLAVHAKYDQESRKKLAEQLAISADITQKLKKSNDSDEEHSDIDTDITANAVTHSAVTNSKNNPWSLSISSEVEDFISSYRKYWETKNKELQHSVPINPSNNNNNNSNNNNDDDDDKSVVKPSTSSEIIRDTLQSKNSKLVEDDANVNNNIPIVKNNSLNTMERVNGNCSKNIEVKNFLEKNKIKIGNKSDLSSGKKKDKLANVSMNKKSETPQLSFKPKSTKKVQNNAKTADSYYLNKKQSSGIWLVTSVKSKAEDPFGDKVKKGFNEKSSNSEIDGLFESLEEKMTTTIKKKVNRIQKKLFKLKNGAKEGRKKKAESDLYLEDPAFTRSRDAVLRPDIDVELNESVGQKLQNNETSNLKVVENVEALPSEDVEIDPQKYIQIQSKIVLSKVPDRLGVGDEEVDDSEAQFMTMMEAFGDDDVMEEFKDMKENEEKTTRLEKVSKTLPGWGSWGGEGILPTKRKRPRKFFETKLPPRKDKNKADMIINEDENSKMKEHLVKEVPFPFTSVSAFEASIRAPIGREWVPETAHQKLIKPPVVTKMGAIIDPMNDEYLNRKLKSKRKSAYKGKLKNDQKKIN